MECVLGRVKPGMKSNATIHGEDLELKNKITAVFYRLFVN